MAGLQWLIEDERHRSAMDLSFCEQARDSLSLSLDWSERWRESQGQPEEGSSLLRALGSRPVVFVAGFLTGSVVAVKIMDAIRQE